MPSTPSINLKVLSGMRSRSSTQAVSERCLQDMRGTSTMLILEKTSIASKRKLSEIIIEDVETMGGGCLNIRLKPSKRSIEKRLDAQGDRRTWTTKDMYKPFPA